MDVEFDYSTEKSAILLKERGIGFDTIIHYINNGHLIDTIQHHHKEKYGHQYFYAVDVEGYIYLVPFVVKDENKVFLKTIFPSRKHTKQYVKNFEKHRGKDHGEKTN
jgi:hypothetical protein